MPVRRELEHLPAKIDRQKVAGPGRGGVDAKTTSQGETSLRAYLNPDLPMGAYYAAGFYA
jgi:hypothetical protein